MKRILPLFLLLTLIAAIPSGAAPMKARVIQQYFAQDDKGRLESFEWTIKELEKCDESLDIIVLPEDDSQESRIYGYYELKLAGYYEPYVTVEGVVNEPGAESMIISEDSVCRITPKEGWHIANAETTSGELVWNDADGSVLLMNVTGDTVLTLEIESIGL